MTGVHALMTVALEGVKSTKDLQKLEFGRGFGSNEPLMIGMQNVASALQKQIVSEYIYPILNAEVQMRIKISFHIDNISLISKAKPIESSSALMY